MSSRYQALSTATLTPYLANIPAINTLLGDSPNTWLIKEVGDGNLNLVFTVQGKKQTVIVKQALPYLRLVGDSWPLPLERSFFEHEALAQEAKYTPQFVPQLYHFDRVMALNIMEYCTPHIILRKGLIAGNYYPHLAEHLSTFMAENLFKTSDLHLKAGEKKKLMKVFCDNTELCKITEDLIFTFPYIKENSNRWTSPELDNMAQSFRTDTAAKLAIHQLKEKFLSQAQAMIHGDLHSGSIMVTREESKIIDPEFAFFGPMGFDIGAFIGNLFLAYFSQPGHATQTDDRTEYSLWLLTTIEQSWELFQQKFIHLWNAQHHGDCFTPALFNDAADKKALQQFQVLYLQQLLVDSLGFAGAKMIRRILGLAHVEDLESITSQALRAHCEQKALHFARNLLVNASSFKTIQVVIQTAAAINQTVSEKEPLSC